jgi:cell division protein FtsL
MMRSTMLWTCLAGAVGIGLFLVKHEVKAMEARLAGINQEIQRNREEIHVLNAEWSYLNDPARLRDLAQRHLGMKPIGPTQVAGFDFLPTLAPAPRAPAVAAAPRPQPAPAASTVPAAKPKPAPARLVASTNLVGDAEGR